jgi:hypothetical protein
MIPSQPLATSSKAEYRVFDQLRQAFSTPDKNGWFAMHSLNLPRHEYKRFGEIDFVLCGPEGLFVLEVKGGGVSCKAGIWETNNRYGETKRLRESPFKQAETALHGLRQKLPASLSRVFVTGYGVILPDVDRLPESAEWDRAVLTDGRDFRQFEKWLERFICHWRAKDRRKPVANPEQLKMLAQHLRPDFEAVVPLHVPAHEVEARIARLTQDQMRLIDVVEANPRVICSGGAGTGKTMLALELAKRWGAKGKKTALVCHSPWLKRFLEQNSVPGLTVSLADRVHVSARRAGIDRFDALIVDEGQDILNLDTLDRLDQYLDGGLSDGYWCFFHDVNNQSGLCGSYEVDAYEYLESFSPVRIPLTTNCRNSLQILQRIQDALGADMGNSGVGEGPAVREKVVADSDSTVQVLADELRGLVDSEGFHPGNIVILSPIPYTQSWASSIPDDLRASIAVLDDASPRSMDRDSIGFAQISDFKGLESEVVVLVDMPRPGHSNTLRSLHYVGMSRARALLTIICC